MSKLVYTSNIPFNMSDWKARNDIISVAAGRNCAMAILQNHTVLKKTCSRSENETSYDVTKLSGRDRFLFINDSSSQYLTQLSLSPENGWRQIKQIAISHFFGCVAIGLREDGSCIVHVDREKSCDCGRALVAKLHVNNLNDIFEVAVSDAIFALHRSGKVFHYSFHVPDDYYQVDYWDNVKHIVTCAQNSVFGITRDGKVLCAGTNCNNLYYELLSEEADVEDVCTVGSEGERIILLHRDGTISSPNASALFENRLSETDTHRFIKLYGHYYHTAFGLTKDHTLIPLFSRLNGHDNEVISHWTGVRSFAMGQKDFSVPFALALLE